MRFKRPAKADPEAVPAEAHDAARDRDIAVAASVQLLEHSEGSLGQLRALADTLPQIVWITQPNGAHEFYNQHWWDYTGLSPDRAFGTGWMSAVHPDDVTQAAMRFDTALRSGEPYETEYRLRRGSDGEYRWFLGRALPYRDSSGQITRWFGTCTDIHAQKLAEQSLRATKSELESLSKAKDEFLSVLSHELRTPLSAILGWVQLLEMGVLDVTEQTEAIATIKDQAKAQSQLIEDLLEVSRIVNGKFHIRDEAVEVHLVIRGAVDAYRAASKDKQLQVEVGPLDTSLFVRGDPQRLQQLAANLISNAIKFTPAGGTVRVSLERVAQHVILRVSDTGRGMTGEMVSRLFKPFQQADGSVNRTSSGLGLGLTIAKHIVDAHRGTITARSGGPNLGSTFEVALPVQAVRPDAYTATAPADFKSIATALKEKSVLLVDDEESARTIVTACLQRAGAEVVVTTSVAEAWAMFTQRPFDALVSDVGMPIESGYDLIRRVRKHPTDAKNIPALALTAFASVDDQTRARDAGFDVYVTKPVEPIDLIQRVAGLITAKLT